MPDFDISQGPDSMPSMGGPDAGLPDAVGNVSQYLQERGGRQAKEQFDAANTSIVHNVTDGTVQVNLPADRFQEYVQAKQHSDQIYAIYDRSVQQIEAQRAQLRAHPFANTLATIAGSLAANDPNPITRGLGQAAARLNPTDRELQAQEQVPLEGMRRTVEDRLQTENAYIARLDAQSRLAETQRHNIESEQAGRETRSEKRSKTLFDEARLMARSGQTMDDKGIQAWLDQRKVTNPQERRNLELTYKAEAKAMADAKELDQENRKELARTRGEEARATENLKARNRYMLADHNHELGLTGKEAFEKFKTQILQDRDLEVVPKETKKALVNLRETDRYLDGMQALLDDPKFANLMGGEKIGRYMTRRLTSEDRVKLENYLKHETPRILNLVLRGGTGGASLLRTEEGRDMVRKLGVMTDLTVGQAKQVLGNIRQVVSQSRRAEMEGTPLAPWENYPDLLGPDKDFRPGGSKGPTYNPATGKVE